MNKDEKEIYRGGVESHEGRVPRWLLIVYVLLLIWGAWYLVAFWEGFPTGP